MNKQGKNRATKKKKNNTYENRVNAKKRGGVKRRDE